MENNNREPIEPADDDQLQSQHDVPPTAGGKKPVGCFGKLVRGPIFIVIGDNEEAKQEKESAVKAEEAAKNGGSQGWLTFRKIFPWLFVDNPDISKEANDERLKRVATVPRRKDGDILKYDRDTYYVPFGDLAPMPFNPPKWFKYWLDLGHDVHGPIQATFLIFIGMYVYSQDLWGGKYVKWLRFLKATIVIHAAFVLSYLLFLAVEYAIRKYMYFRLLSFRILVDWENKKAFKLFFTYWLCISTVFLFSLAIAGIVLTKKKNKDADPVSVALSYLIITQSIQVVLGFFKLLNGEKSLLALNDLFERDPTHAQNLVELTYVIEEEDLIDECFRVWYGSWAAWGERLKYIFSLGWRGQRWHQEWTALAFDLERLKQASSKNGNNGEKVKAAEERLRAERQSAAAAASGDTSHSAEPSDSGASACGAGCDIAANIGKATQQVTVQLHAQAQTPVQAEEGVVIEATQDTKARNDGADAQAAAAEAPGSTEPEAEAAAADGHAFSCSCFCCACTCDSSAVKPGEAGEGGAAKRGGGQPPSGWVKEAAHWVFRRWYASLYALHICSMPGCPTWPYKDDKFYFRWLVLTQSACWIAVVGVIVYGVVWASGHRDPCAVGGSYCAKCVKYYGHYVNISTAQSCENIFTPLTKIVNAVVYDDALKVYKQNSTAKTLLMGYCKPVSTENGTYVDMDDDEYSNYDPSFYNLDYS